MTFVYVLVQHIRYPVVHILYFRVVGVRVVGLRVRAEVKYAGETLVMRYTTRRGA